MSYTDAKLDYEQKRLLTSLIGKRLNSISYHAQTAEFCAWEWVWLEFGNCAIEISDSLEPLDYYGELEEVAVLRVGLVEEVESKGRLEGQPIRRIDVDATVDDIVLVEDERFRHHGGEIKDTFITTDAIVLRTSGQDICIKKSIWFSEMTDIAFGPSFMELLNDIDYDFDDADEEREDGNTLSVRRTIRSMADFEPMTIISTHPNGCPECGGDTVATIEDSCLSNSCRKCDWSVASTYIPMIHQDEAVYTVVLNNAESGGGAAISAVSKVAGCNFLQAKALIDSASAVFEGSAVEVREKAAILEDAGVPFSISPEWRY